MPKTREGVQETEQGQTQPGQAQTQPGQGSQPVAISQGQTLTRDFSRDFGTSPRSKTQQHVQFSETVRHNAKILSNLELTWSQPPTSVLIVKRHKDPDVSNLAMNLIEWLVLQKQFTVYLEKSALEDQTLSWIEDSGMDVAQPPLIPRHIISKRIIIIHDDEEDEAVIEPVDFIVTLGGDGTVLYAASLFQEAIPPIVPFNLGSLGFLTVFDFSKYKEVLEDVINGRVRMNLRMRLSCSVASEEGVVVDDFDLQEIQALNEVVIERGRSPYMAMLELFIDGSQITTAHADGLIIATPTGSTAYSLSAGGPILHPSVPGILVTPICPHTLSFRPLVLPDSVELKITVPKQSRVDAWVSFDGRNNLVLKQGQSMIIKASRYPVPTACKQDLSQDLFGSLARCLNWNVRESQKPFDTNQVILNASANDKVRRKTSRMKTRLGSES